MRKARKPLVVDCHAVIGAGSTWADPEREANYDLSLLFERGSEAGIDLHCVMPARSHCHCDWRASSWRSSRQEEPPGSACRSASG